jgi:hypothetical protein
VELLNRKLLNRKLSGLKALSLIGFTILLAACGGSGGSTDIATASIDPLLDVDPSGASSANDNLQDLIDALPVEQLSDAEIVALSFMREEEKLARDVYLYLYDIWSTNIFINIANSEQTHTDAVLWLIEKYGLDDPAQGKARGEFTDLRHAHCAGIFQSDRRIDCRRHDRRPGYI